MAIKGSKTQVNAIKNRAIVYKKNGLIEQSLELLEQALTITKQKPKLLSDNGSCYIASELKSYLKDNYQMQQVHGRPNHPQTQGKIDSYHRTMKNVVKLDNYFAPEELEAALQKFVNDTIMSDIMNH